MKRRAAEGVPFTDVEVDAVTESLRQAWSGDRRPREDAGDPDRSASAPAGHRNEALAVLMPALGAFVRARAHLPPKRWPVVREGLVMLRGVVGEPGEALFDALFRRVLEGGKWHNAAQHAAAANAAAEARAANPWVVLVMGCNGIRKTTSVFQSWFKSALAFSLGDTYTGRVEDLPDGNNSFFRQLDFMMANVASVDFANMYSSACCDPERITAQDNIEAYMALKGAIFARYRGLCEMLGGLLLESASKRMMNVMLETSGKDIASFDYVNFFFPGDRYRKMVVYFDVDRLEFAKLSVDERMRKEMSLGRALVGELETTPAELMAVNCGGPYGGKQLSGVEAAARAMWEQVMAAKKAEEEEEGGVNGDGATWSSWHFARVAIGGSADPSGKGWEARGVGVADESRRSAPWTTFVREAVGGAGDRPKKRAKVEMAQPAGEQRELPPLTFDAGIGEGAEYQGRVGMSAAHTLLDTGVVAVERILGGEALRVLRDHCRRVFTGFDARLTERRLDFRTQDTAFSFASVASRDRGRLDVNLNLNAAGESSIVEELRNHPVLRGFCRHLGLSPRPLLSGVVFSLPGSVPQAWHRDGDHLFPDRPDLPPHAVTVFVPLADIASPGLVATQFCPGTHLLSDDACNAAEHHVFAYNPMRAGSCIMLDYRTLHRGVPNTTTDELRPLVYMVFAKPWFLDCKNFSEDVL